MTFLLLAPAAPGKTGRMVSLKLAGSHAKALGMCGKEKQPDLYSTVKHGVSVDLVGSVTPAPKQAAWQVRIVGKRCINGHYTKVWTKLATGRKGGVFRLAYTPKAAGRMIVLADYGKHPNVFSTKLRLHVV